MNNKGQSLVLFIVIIPLIICLLALLVDMGLVVSKKVKLREITTMAIKENINKVDKDAIKKLMEKNDIDVSKLEVINNDNRLRIKIEIEIDSIFGKIIGLKKYKIKVDLTGYKENNKVYIE